MSSNNVSPCLGQLFFTDFFYLIGKTKKPALLIDIGRNTVRMLNIWKMGKFWFSKMADNS